MSRNNRDQLIDQLLREVLGGDRPRDMTARVLAQARIIDRFRRRNWYLGGSAIAAAIALAVGLTMYWPHAYPEPAAQQVVITDGGVMERGAHIETDDLDTGTVELGNYVYIKMAPQTAMTIGGAKYEEKVLLDQGQLDVSVTKNKGRFDIAVGPATVHVTGTKFGVNVTNEITSAARLKKLTVAVKEGSVEVQNVPGVTGIQTVAAGQEKTFTISLAQIRAAARANAGLLAAAQDGARVGGRGGLVTTITPAPRLVAPVPTQPANVSPATRISSVAPSATATANAARSVQLTTTPGSPTRYGNVLRTGSVFYLASRDGNYFMFEQASIAAAHPKWLSLSPTQTSRVVWTEGVVTDIVETTSTAPAATPLPK